LLQVYLCLNNNSAPFDRDGDWYPGDEPRFFQPAAFKVDGPRVG